MLFVITALDKPNATEKRIALRPSHLSFVEEHKAIVKAAGPFLTDDGQSMIGSMLVIDVAGRAAAEAFAARDPYAIGGLFAEVTIRPWRWTVGAP